MRLRKALEERYDNLPTDALLVKVLSIQEQATLDLNTSSQEQHQEASAALAVAQ
ncbi:MULTISPECIES: hypothetical protein [Pseudomonas fluorescens group]|uniref:Uncharacterized protein n=1 Tax=Pseudomonas petroselini TaxID=2899822 RepID=A0ABS8QPI4_9PSED|nr:MULTISPECIES: hypothetical protein [Pseudomonas fluorescens group]MCD7037313.1 hypothetical protein [Pseudomonas petroselini]MCD7047376.1 hypothetical protein [Pseudomonas petroselini]MCD7069316.1 hypothetical protein [Pseudomonas petroselini]